MANGARSNGSNPPTRVLEIITENGQSRVVTDRRGGVRSRGELWRCLRRQLENGRVRIPIVPMSHQYDYENFLDPSARHLPSLRDLTTVYYRQRSADYLWGYEVILSHGRRAIHMWTTSPPISIAFWIRTGIDLKKSLSTRSAACRSWKNRNEELHQWPRGFLRITSSAWAKLKSAVFVAAGFCRMGLPAPVASARLLPSGSCQASHKWICGIWTFVASVRHIHLLPSP